MADCEPLQGLHSGATLAKPGVQKGLILRGFLEAALKWRRGRDSAPIIFRTPILQAFRASCDAAGTNAGTMTGTFAKRKPRRNPPRHTSSHGVAKRVVGVRMSRGRERDGVSQAHAGAAGGPAGAAGASFDG